MCNCKIKYFLTVLNFIFLSVFCTISAQVVNIEGKRIHTDTSGFAGHIDLGMSLEKNVSQLLNISGNSLIQYKTRNNRHLFLFMADAGIVRSGGVDLINRYLGHLRYNTRFLTDWLKWEALMQFQRNPLIDIEARYLYGTGFRFKLSENIKYRFYLGTTYIYEHERGFQDNREEFNHRWSNYFSFSILPGENFTLKSTTYFQPILTLFEDYRLMEDLRLEFKITKNLTYTTSFEMIYDTRPPAGIPQLIYLVRNGIGYKF